MMKIYLYYNNAYMRVHHMMNVEAEFEFFQ